MLQGRLSRAAAVEDAIKQTLITAAAQFTGEAKTEYNQWAESVVPLVTRYVGLVAAGNASAGEVLKSLEAQSIARAADLEILGEASGYKTAGNIAVVVAAAAAKLLILV